MNNLDEIKYKFDQIAFSYEDEYKQNSIFGYEKVRRIELVKDFIQSHNPENILDAGCGPGTSIPYLREQLNGVKIFGIDISIQMLINARLNNPESILFIQSNVEDIPFKEGIFDLVFSLGVTDYVIHLEDMFYSIYRVLSPGGYFIFSYPNGNSVFRSFREAILSSHPKKRNSGFSRAVKMREINILSADLKLDVLHQEFITYGLGLISSPWSVNLSKLLEKNIKNKTIKKFMAWTVFCIVQKPNHIV
jgi:ubiquinone/menaquinone biosynthesis C-methylase UbiE